MASDTNAREPNRVRTSDAERERIAETLRNAVTEGRLTLEEGDERLATLYATKYRDELAPLIADLPVAPDPRGRRRGPEPVWTPGTGSRPGYGWWGGAAPSEPQDSPSGTDDESAGARVGVGGPGYGPGWPGPGWGGPGWGGRGRGGLGWGRGFGPLRFLRVLFIVALIVVLASIFGGHFFWLPLLFIGFAVVRCGLFRGWRRWRP